MHGKGQEARSLEHSAPGLPLASLEVRVQMSFIPSWCQTQGEEPMAGGLPVLTCLPCKGEGSYRTLLQGRGYKCRLPGMVSQCSSPAFVHSASQRTVGDTCRHTLGGREVGEESQAAAG